MKIIKPYRYELSPSVTADHLLKAGFQKGCWIEASKSDYVKDNWYSKTYVLNPGEITLTIAIDITHLSDWNDFDGIEVIDESLGQPYQPFYEYREEHGKHLIMGQFPFLEKVYQIYDKEMLKLVQQDIFHVKVVM